MLIIIIKCDEINCKVRKIWYYKDYFIKIKMNKKYMDLRKWFL